MSESASEVKTKEQFYNKNKSVEAFVSAVGFNVIYQEGKREYGRWRVSNSFNRIATQD